jgi:hypothetical protein
MERQSNDRLGRIQRQRFEHWRQILCAKWLVTNTYSYCHSHAYINTHSHSYTNTNTYCHSHAYTDSHSYPHSNGHTYTYSDAYAYAYANPVHWEMFTDAEALSDFG